MSIGLTQTHTVLGKITEDMVLLQLEHERVKAELAAAQARVAELEVKQSEPDAVGGE